ncbi:MAG: 50S ribosomal protein L21 [Chlamydiae bacterium SM23_39]|nr:MAG: 50S ribosomal protein L21 [Chlamydiae bacterium SM23_39]
MYAIFESGSKQYLIKEGDIIEVELLKKSSSEKTDVEFKNVLFINDGKNIEIGTPYLKNYYINGKILKEIKGPKVIAFKYKRRKNYKKTTGHRQKYSKVQILKINKVS